jgi:hypothetical protein
VAAAKEQTVSWEEVVRLAQAAGLSPQKALDILTGAVGKDGSAVFRVTPVSRKMVSVCSSRRRAGRCKEMIESWLKTATGLESQLAVYVADNDPQLTEYRKIPKDKRWKLVVGPEKSLVAAVNGLVKDFPDYEFYHEINDDHICRTEGWDIRLMAAVNSKNGGYSIAYGKTKNMPTSVMYGGKLVRVLGNRMFPDAFRHSYIDDWLMILGQSANLLKYVPDVEIEHVHWMFGQAEKDEVYEGVVADYEHGKRVLEQERGKLTELILRLRGFFPGEPKPDATATESLRRAGIPDDFGPGHKDWGNPGKAAWQSKWLRYRGEL